MSEGNSGLDRDVIRRLPLGFIGGTQNLPSLTELYAHKNAASDADGTADYSETDVIDEDAGLAAGYVADVVSHPEVSDSHQLNLGNQSMYAGVFGPDAPIVIIEKVYVPVPMEGHGTAEMTSSLEDEGLIMDASAEVALTDEAVEETRKTVQEVQAQPPQPQATIQAPNALTFIRETFLPDTDPYEDVLIQLRERGIMNVRQFVRTSGDGRPYFTNEIIMSVVTAHILGRRAETAESPEELFIQVLHDHALLLMEQLKERVKQQQSRLSASTPATAANKKFSKFLSSSFSAPQATAPTEQIITDQDIEAFENYVISEFGQGNVIQGADETKVYVPGDFCASHFELESPDRRVLLRTRNKLALVATYPSSGNSFLLEFMGNDHSDQERASVKVLKLTGQAADELDEAVEYLSGSRSR